jgi:hypothetical protein
MSAPPAAVGAPSIVVHSRRFTANGRPGGGGAAKGPRRAAPLPGSTARRRRCCCRRRSRLQRELAAGVSCGPLDLLLQLLALLLLGQGAAQRARPLGAQVEGEVRLGVWGGWGLGFNDWGRADVTRWGCRRGRCGARPGVSATPGNGRRPALAIARLATLPPPRRLLLFYVALSGLPSNRLPTWKEGAACFRAPQEGRGPLPRCRRPIPRGPQLKEAGASCRPQGVITGLRPGLQNVAAALKTSVRKTTRQTRLSWGALCWRGGVCRPLLGRAGRAGRPFTPSPRC